MPPAQKSLLRFYSGFASASVTRGHCMKHHLLPVSPANVQWGYFSKKSQPALTLKSGDRATIETLTHHANDDYERMIAERSGRRERVSLDPGAQSRRSSRRGPNQRSVPAGVRRRARRSSPNRTGSDRERRTWRYSRSPHPRCASTSELQRLPCRALLRLERRSIMGISLQRPDRGAEAARGHHDFRAG